MVGDRAAIDAATKLAELVELRAAMRESTDQVMRLFEKLHQGYRSGGNWIEVGVGLLQQAERDDRKWFTALRGHLGNGEPHGYAPAAQESA